MDLTSFFVWWFLYVPLFAGIPLIYVSFLIFDLWRKKALTQIGNMSNDVKVARALGKYFLKLFVVFVGMWVPAIVGI